MMGPDCGTAILDGVPLGFANAVRRGRSGLTPVINTGIAYREAGIGQIGAGIARAPLACFSGALRALGERLGLMT
jgi:succinyl-CoA synthetase alpha subunit